MGVFSSKSGAKSQMSSEARGWLVTYEFDGFESKLSKIGVRSLQDLHLVKQTDLEAMGMPPIQARRFMEKVAGIAGSGGGGAATGETVVARVVDASESVVAEAVAFPGNCDKNNAKTKSSLSDTPATNKARGLKELKGGAAEKSPGCHRAAGRAEQTKIAKLLFLVDCTGSMGCELFVARLDVVRFPSLLLISDRARRRFDQGPSRM